MKSREPDLPMPGSSNFAAGLSSWWRRRPVMAAAAAILVFAVLAVLVRSLSESPQVVEGPGQPSGQTSESSPEADLAQLHLEWPSDEPFDPSTLQAWGLPFEPLPQAMPDFDRATGTLGAQSDDRFLRWRMATVIVRSGNGWGSGAVISGDGWILTNYHVVAVPAQEAAASGNGPASLEIILPQVAGNQLKPRSAQKATLYRADPVRDLALLKLDASAGEMPHFELGREVREGGDCYVIGSQHNGPAWWIRGGIISQQFEFPQGLSQFAAGATGPSSDVSRTRATVVVTDARVSGGDSGGPLLDDKGSLIGLTFATAANRTAGSVGWHIALKHLRAFTADLPETPEGVPFDAWTAGLPKAAILRPELADADGDGRKDSLRYRYATRSTSAQKSSSRAVAFTVFMDLAQRTTSAKAALDLLPRGLWGLQDRGGFRFDLFLTVRADGVTAVGYADADGIVDEIRMGRNRQREATMVWRRNSSGVWRSVTPSTPLPMIDRDRLDPDQLRRLMAMGGSVVTPSRGGGPNVMDPDAADSKDRRGPNVR